MKLYKCIFAALLMGAASAYAQISSFSVTSYSGSGDDTQIAGLTASTDALLNISTTGTPSLYNFTPYFGSYYTVAASVGATIVANATGYFTTTVTNQYAPGQGYSSTAPLANVSGRFYIEAPYTDPDTYEQVGGSTGTVSFTVSVAGYYTIGTMGYYDLAPYGLTGVSNPEAYLYDSSWNYKGSLSGEGYSGAIYLSAGTYNLYCSADVDTSSGIGVFSIFAQ